MTAILRLLTFGLAVPMLAVMLTNAAQSVELDPNSVAFQKPDQFKWRDPSNKGPSNGVALHGDGVSGFYAAIIKWNKGGNFSRPHFHPNDRMIFVMSGTWWNGTGTAFDPANTIPMRAGTMVFHHAKGIHWDGAKDEDAVLMAYGVGPAASTRAKETEGTFSQLNPEAVTFRTPDQMKWRDPTNKAPTNQTILYGDPRRPGPYVVINRFLPGSFNSPRTHPNDRFVMVLRGTLWVGSGATFDTNNTVPMPTGTFVTYFGKGIHYHGARDDEVHLLIGGIGPTAITPAEEK